MAGLGVLDGIEEGRPQRRLEAREAGVQVQGVPAEGVLSGEALESPLDDGAVHAAAVVTPPVEHLDGALELGDEAPQDSEEGAEPLLVGSARIVSRTFEVSEPACSAIAHFCTLAAVATACTESPSSPRAMMMARRLQDVPAGRRRLRFGARWAHVPSIRSCHGSPSRRRAGGCGRRIVIRPRYTAI